MMMNLFSVFDPSSSIMKSAWLAIPFVMVAYSVSVWNMNSPFIKLMKNVNNKFSMEVKFSLGKKEKGTEMMIMTIFFSIIMMNFIALYPQIFSVTSHLTITLPLAITFWLSLMLFGWMKNTNHMLSHLVPQGTPGALMMFMVLIELTSNLIRPITLCVRLTANLIAGHLLMTLLGNFILTMPMLISSTMIFMPIILSVLESAVACIQAYVFMTLITLYVTELK